jgi:hypothetical protein
MRATEQGQTPAQIRATIDARYVRGETVPTPQPPAP